MGTYQQDRHQRLTRTPVSPDELSFEGLRLIVWPAGRCEVDVAMAAHAINVPTDTAQARMALNSDRLDPWEVSAGSLAFFPAGTDFRIRVDNPSPQIILEVSEDRMAEWLDWAGCSASSADSFLDWRPDPLADGLAKRALRHLTSERQMERLTFEATCLSLAERAIERLRVEMGQRSIDMSVGTAPLTTNLRRAIEWAEAHLSDQSLSVSGMARAAGLSASQFTVAFRAATRETPYAFVLRRRAERAVQMLRDSDRSIAQIAFDCGFSSSAHAGTVVKKHFGVTPGEIRRSLG